MTEMNDKKKSFFLLSNPYSRFSFSILSVSILIIGIDVNPLDRLPEADE